MTVAGPSPRPAADGLAVRAAPAGRLRDPLQPWGRSEILPETLPQARPDAVAPAAPSPDSVAEQQAAVLDARLRDADPLEILQAASDLYGDQLALVSSFGAESAVLLHLASRVRPQIPVLFLDTGMLFGQTLDYRKQLAARLGLTDVRDLRPRFQDLAVGDPDARLWKTDTDACCNIRKVMPLDRALAGFEGWVTGRKRFHGGDRLRLAVVEASEGKLKFNPLANWDKADLDAYLALHDLPAHPLVAQGFPSIGCWPCTNPVEDGEDVRSGRWAGQGKTECGIHVARAHVAPPNVGGDI
ncbi:MAG: phosphoadenylyl-sulfate reductase [Caulobacter sp.]|nr:phosphoadenylyl-sulfate reductase [Caulobacter sp.]